MFGNLGTTELILILLGVLILFGAKRIPELAKGLGKGITQFKREIKGIEEDVNKSVKPLNELPTSITKDDKNHVLK